MQSSAVFPKNILLPRSPPLPTFYQGVYPLFSELLAAVFAVQLPGSQSILQETSVSRSKSSRNVRRCSRNVSRSSRNVSSSEAEP